LAATAQTDVSEEVFTVVPGQTEAGKSIFAVLVKRTYDIRPNQVAERAEQTNPLIQVDLYYDDGDPETATLQYENDLTPYKVATDVVLVGKAYAPLGKPVTSLDVAVEVAGRRKAIRVIGDRRCAHRQDRDPVFTDPEPFAEMEIRYERAYGGKDLKSHELFEYYYPRNTMGSGLAIKNMTEVVDGLRLPNLEDPADLLTPERLVLGQMERWNQMPLPQGFGWYQKTWYPRCSFVGAVPAFVNLDEPMREEALGLVPKRQIALARQFRLPAYDIRFNNGASLGLAFPFLAGGELVKLMNLTPTGYLSFALPKEAPRIVLDIGLGENELKPVLQTVTIRPNEMQLDLVWRGAHEHPGIDWLPEMKKMVATVN
jgi:hypothetical protein